MISLPSGLAAHYASKCTTLADALKVTRRDGAVYGFTSHDRDSPPIGGVVYACDPGLMVTDIVNSAGPTVGNLEITALHDDTLFTTAEILAGVWRNADFIIFRYNWVTPTDGIHVLLAGKFGETKIQQNKVVLELRDLMQYLQQPVGSASSKNCRYRLGSTDKNNGGLCMKNISAAPFTVAFTVTDVTSNQVFRDDSLVHADDWFGNGEVNWLTGDNAGAVDSMVKEYTIDGTFTLALPQIGAIQVGDTGIAIAGCRKRVIEDCKDKFGNVPNFGGEPHRMGTNSVTQSEVPSV